jgi:hypothetical protein
MRIKKKDELEEISKKNSIPLKKVLETYKDFEVYFYNT